ncbi:MAG: hypothetical protein COB53_00390 [Elusimicrobia bacterium]|nr:MAG: hypothetical protein COB53_00390 [Elusimicrobiota bacterium]
MADFKIELTKEQQQYLVVAVLFIGGGGFAYVKYFWGPTSEKITTTAETIEQIERKIQKAKRQAGRLNKIKKQLVRLNEEGEKVEKKLPKELDLPGIIDTITGLAEKNNLEIQVFSAPSATTRAHFKEFTFNLSITSTYHDLGRFLAAVALEERIFNTRNVTFGRGAGTSRSGETKLTVSLSLIAYQYKG